MAGHKVHTRLQCIQV